MYFLRRVLLLTFLLSFVSCTTINKPDSEITEKWVQGDLPDLEELVSQDEAILFVEHFFKVTDKVIFDESFKNNGRVKAKNTTISKIKNKKSLTRKGVLDTLNSSIKGIGVSHLIALHPKQTKYIINMTGGEKDKKPEPMVSSKVMGDFGIIKVKSFLVPSITLKQVLKAREKTKNAKYLIYDLRNNGGGSGSSASYLIETILGPNKTIKFSKTRSGMSKASPVLKHGYFDDQNNFGSEQEIDFEKEKGFVEWRTRKEAQKDGRKTFVIVNKKCASSCDIFASAIKEHKAATLVGDKTAGHVLGGTAFKLLWRGYISIVPTAQIVSPDGVLYEGVGVKPDKVIKSCNKDNDKCLKDVMRLAKKKL